MDLNLDVILPIVSRDSPFRLLPDRVPKNQILFFDAIRLSAEMVEQAYRRLYDLLLEATDEGDGKIAVSALIDAYTVVDSIYRFRGVLNSTRGIKHNHLYELFIRRTSNIEPLRHIVQHLNGEVRKIAEAGLGALGTLTWVGPSSHPKGPPRMCILQPGTFYPQQKIFGPEVDLVSTVVPGSIADITLRTSGAQVNLSKSVGALSEFFRSLEASLREIEPRERRHGSDTLMRIDFVPIAPGSVTDTEERER